MDRLSEEIKDKIILFIKFGKKERLEALQRGNLYMNNFRYFSNLEREKETKGMGDEYEGSIVFKNMDLTFSDYDSGEPIFGAFADSVKMTSESDMEKPIFCMTCFTIGDLRDIEIDDHTIKGTLEFTNEQKEKITKEFGSHALLLSGGHLLKFIDEQFNNNDIIYIGGKTKYSDFNINYIDRIESSMIKSTNKFFWKDKSLEYQNEYRIVILNKNSNGPSNYNIGDIEQYTKLTTTDKFLNGKYSIIINYI